MKLVICRICRTVLTPTLQGGACCTCGDVEANVDSFGSEHPVVYRGPVIRVEIPNVFLDEVPRRPTMIPAWVVGVDTIGWQDGDAPSGQVTEKNMPPEAMP